MDYVPREGLDYQEDDEPCNPLGDALGEAEGKIPLLWPGHGGHLLHVLRDLCLHHVQDVVYRDNTHQPAFLVHHRDGQDVILLYDLGGEFLVIRGLHMVDHGVHYLSNLLGGWGEDDVPEGADAYEFAGFIHHVAAVNGLLVQSYAPGQWPPGRSSPERGLRIRWL